MDGASFQGRVAIVTGASSGIGRATALALADHGACVALAARRTSALEELAAQIVSKGREALVVTTDVTRQDQVERLMSQTLARWGQVDILVANSGQYIRSPVAKVSPSILEQSMAINFYGNVYPILLVLPHMLARQSGHIVLVSTMDAKKGLPLDAPYVAAKAAMSGFCEVLRQELRGSGIFVTTVFPARVDTPMIDHLKVPWISAKIPPEAVSRAILRGIQRRKAEIILPPRAILLHALNFFSPGLADSAARFFHLQGWEN